MSERQLSSQKLVPYLLSMQDFRSFIAKALAPLIPFAPLAVLAKTGLPVLSHLSTLPLPVSSLRRLIAHLVGISLKCLHRPMARQLHGKIGIHPILNQSTGKGMLCRPRQRGSARTMG
jgi:hypothetical protein